MSLLQLLLSMGGESRNLYGLRFWDAFQDTDATPVATPRRVWSGQWVDVTQVGSNLSIANNNLKSIGGTNFTRTQDTWPRTSGLALLSKINYTSTGTTTNRTIFQYGDNSDAYGFIVTSNVLSFVDRFGVMNIKTLSPGVDYYIFTIIRAEGAYSIFKDGDDWILAAISEWNPITSTLKLYTSVSAVCQTDYTRLAQFVNSSWVNQYGLATDHTLVVATNTQITGLANGWVLINRTNNATGTQIIALNYIDDNNYIKLSITGSVASFFQRVAGVDTLIGSTVSAFGAGEYRFKILEGNLSCYTRKSGNMLIYSGTFVLPAYNNNVKIIDISTGTISVLATFPYFLIQLNALAEILQTFSIPEPPDSSITPRTIYASASAISGTGTIGNPYTLAQALAVLEPGVTLVLRGGSYPNATINITQNGLPQFPITIKPYPGEHVIIDSLDDLLISGSDITINGGDGILEFYCDSWTGDRFLTSQHFDVGIQGVRAKILNCVFHDFGNIGFWSNATDSEFSGNLIYNIGRGNGSLGHPLYTQNNFGQKIIENNCIVQTYESTFTIHQYGSGASTLRGYLYRNNLAHGGRWLLGSAGSKIEEVEVYDNIVSGARIEVGLLGPSDPLHSDFKINGNHLQSIAIKKGDNFEIRNNVFVRETFAVTEINNASNATIEGNEYNYYNFTPVNKWQYNSVNSPTFADWQSRGFDLLGSFNDYSPGVAPDYHRLIVFNNQQSGILYIENFSVSQYFNKNYYGLLENGATFRFYNAMNFAEYVDIVNDDSIKQIDMLAAWTNSIPIGTAGGAMTPPPNPFPEKGMFYIRKIS